MNDSTTTNVNNVRLSASHLIELAASGITPEVATAAGLYTETDPARVGKLLNWTCPAKTLGQSLVFPYLDADGRPMDYHRLKPSTPRASKNKEDNGKRIKYEGPKGTPNRLYIPPGTRAAVADPAADLILTEGEKKALAADGAGLSCLSIPGVWAWQKKRPKGADGKGTGPRELIDDLKAVAWKGRRVFVVFDSDSATNPGVQAALRALAGVLGKAGAVVVVVRLPAGPNAEKTGLDDYLVRHGPDAFQGLVSAAVESATSEGDESAHKEKKPNAADQLADIATNEAELWHDSSHAGFATVGRRSMAVRSKAFRQWLTRRFRALSGGRVPNSEALGNAVNAVEAQAVFDGPEHEAHVRVATHEGRVYLHMADDADTVIVVDAAGYRECHDPPVRFRCASGARPLPLPEPGGDFDDLGRLLNLEDADQFALIVAFLCGALHPGEPQPALVANGEQGSGKSTLSRVLKALIDPSAAPVRCEPRDGRDLMIAARNAHLLVLDNLSNIKPWLSDALCRLATGGGFATRELYSNDDEVIFDARRPTILNGIEDGLVNRGDLLERSILLRLPSIPEDKRIPEAEFWARFHALHPKLLGALLDRVAGGLRELPGVKLDKLPRMADFARWGVACERGVGGHPRFLAAYLANQCGAHEQALEGSSLTAALLSLMQGRDDWEGTASELFRLLVPPEPIPQDWPKAANSLAGKLRRLAPDLRRVHRIDFATDRTTDASRRRIIRLTRIPAEGTPSEPSGPPRSPCKYAGNLDGRQKDAFHPPAEPSIPLRTNGQGADDSDDTDGPAVSVGSITAAEYARFLQSH